MARARKYIQLQNRVCGSLLLFAVLSLMHSACSRTGNGSQSSSPDPAEPGPDPVEPIEPVEPEEPQEPNPQPPSSSNCRIYPSKYEMRKTFLSQIQKPDLYANTCAFDSEELVFTCNEAKYVDGTPGISVPRRWHYEYDRLFISDINFFKHHEFLDRDETIYLSILDFDSSRLISYYKFDSDGDLDRVGRVVERNSADLPTLIEEEDPDDPLCDDTISIVYTNDLLIEREDRLRRADDGNGGCDTIRDTRLEFRYNNDGFLERKLETIVVYDPIADETSLEINRYNFSYEEFTEYCE